MFTKLIKAKDVQQGQLFMFPNGPKPDCDLGTFRRVYENGYITLVRGSVVGASDTMLMFCHPENNVYVQDFSEK